MTDVSMALRRFRRKPLFFVGACALLALAVGGNTAIFALVNAIVLRPLPLAGADDIVALHVVRDGTPRGAFSLPMFLDLAAAPGTLDGVAASFQWSANLTDAGDAERVQALRVTGNYLQVLGASVAFGRPLTAADATSQSASAVVIGDALWKRRFEGSANAIGRSIRLNGQVFTVVGVLRPDFPFQLPDAELIVPWLPEEDPRRANAALTFLRVVGRLAPGAGIPQVQAELDSRLEAFERKFPEAAAGDRGGRAVSLREDILGNTGQLLTALAVAVGLVLLIVAANLTNLLLVNGAGRRQEFTTRQALGASSRRLLAQLLTEALVLAAAGTLSGIVVAQLAISALLAMSGAVVRRAAEVSLDGTAVLVACALGVAIAVGSAVVPALQLSFVRSRAVADQRSVTSGGRTLRAAFVCAEVALSVLLVIAAGLLVRSFVALQQVDPGFQPAGVLSLRLSLPRNRYEASADLVRFHDRLAPRIRRIPGIAAVAAANVVPMNGYLATATIQIPGVEHRSASEWPDVHYRMISPDYFSAMGIPLVAGRPFSEHDDADSTAVAIVSRGLANRYWPQKNPVGAQLLVRDDNARFRSVQVVGIVGDVRHFGLEQDSPLELYVPIPQVPDATSVWLANNMYWVAKTRGNPLSYADAIRREVAAVDSEVASSFVRSMDQWLGRSMATRRFNLLAIATFAITALLLAGIGIYSVAAEAVILRTREMGVRAALGATDSQLKSTIVRGGLAPVVAGVVLGTGGALAMMNVVTSFLYGVPAHDPLTFAAVFLLVATVGAVAVYIPARQVTRIDPVIALRTE